MKKIFSIFLSGILLSEARPAFSGPEEGAPPPPPPPHARRARGGNRHPLLSALESKEFSEEERAQLRQLASKDPRAFEQRMRKHFFQRRQEKAKHMLALRAAYLEAKTPELKEAALAKIRTEMREEEENHLKFQKRLLDNTEQAIRGMEKRLSAMKRRYQKHEAEKEERLERRIRDLISDTPPERLLKDAAGDFSKPKKPRPKKP